MEDKPDEDAKDQHKVQITRYELAWVLALSGTGLGAGVLYLPFAIGTGGLLPILVLTVYCVPLVFLSHRNLSRLCLSPEVPAADMHSVIRYVFPRHYSSLFIVICFLSVFPTLLVYAIGIINITTSFIDNQLQLAVPSTSLVSLILIVVLVSVLVGGEKSLLKVAGGMVTPLTVLMLCFSSVSDSLLED